MSCTNKEIFIRKQKFSILSLKEIDKKEYLHKLPMLLRVLAENSIRNGCSQDEVIEKCYEWVKSNGRQPITFSIKPNTFLISDNTKLDWTKSITNPKTEENDRLSLYTLINSSETSSFSNLENNTKITHPNWQLLPHNMLQ